MNKKVKKKNPLKLKACAVALSLWGLSAVLALSSSPVMAAETASNAAQEQVAKALFNKGGDLYELHRYEESIAEYIDLITTPNPQYKKISQYTKIKEFELGSLHRYLLEEALATYNDLITRFGNSQDKIIQEAVANALLNKGADLQSSLLDRPEEAIAAYNDLITRFSNSQDKIIQELVANAFPTRGLQGV